MADGITDWVSDQLHDILGLSDRYTAEYFVGLARKAPSHESFVKQLQKTGAVTVNEAIHKFSLELWDRVPHQKMIEKPARVKEREALMQREKNKRYQMIMDDSDEEETSSKRKRRPSSSSSSNSRRGTYINDGTGI